MIRRGFWLTAGAVTGIYGYRRVSAAGRRLSATLTPGRLTPGRLTPASLAPEGTLELARAGARARVTGRRARRGAFALARESYRFTRDVREGMELYRLAHPAPAGSTLSADRVLPTDQHRPTDHEPEDGH
jgi:hypothetical protein